MKNKYWNMCCSFIYLVLQLVVTSTFAANKHPLFNHVMQRCSRETQTEWDRGSLCTNTKESFVLAAFSAETMHCTNVWGSFNSGRSGQTGGFPLYLILLLESLLCFLTLLHQHKPQKAGHGLQLHSVQMSNYHSLIVGCPISTWVPTFGFPSWMAFAGVQHGLFLLDLSERKAWERRQTSTL